MKKKVYSKILVLSALSGMALTGVATSALFSKCDKSPIAVNAEGELSFVEWKGKFAGGWNPNPDALKDNLCAYIIALNGNGFPKVNGSNLRDVPESGGQVTINGVPLNQLENKHNVTFDHSQDNQYVLLRFRKDQIVALEGKDYCEVHINEGTVFDGYKLRELTIRINPTTYVASFAPSKKIETSITAIDPCVWPAADGSGGWFRIDLDGYPSVAQETISYNSYNFLNFANKIYVNGDPSNLFLTPGKDTYSMTFNIQDSKGLSFNMSELVTKHAGIQSITIPEGTEFPYKTLTGVADYTTCFVTKRTQTFVRYGNIFCEEVPTSVTNYYPRVWGANQRAFGLEGFTDNSGSGGEKSNHSFNFNSNIYINKDPNNCLFESPTRVSTYYEMGHPNTFGVVLAKDFDTNPETYVTIPAGTQFPDSKAWKGQIGGKVFVTQEDTTFTRLDDKNFKKCTDIVESANYGVTSLEGFTGKTEDYVCSGTKMTSVPINNYSPFGDGNIHLSFKVNNEIGNNFSSNILINSVLAGNGVNGGYKFNFARGYGKVLYNDEEISPVTYFNGDFFDGKDWLVDIYVIKQDETHVRLAMTMNGYALVDMVRDCSSDVMGNLTQMTVYTTTELKTTIKNIDVDAQALDLFCEKGLKMSDATATSDNYANAKEYLLTLLTEKQKEMFFSSSTYASAVARLESWAQENSEHAIATVNFTGINTYNNNKDIPSSSDKITYLEFDSKPFNGTSQTNIAGTFATINGVNCSTIDGFMMNCRDNGGNFVLMYYPASALTTTETYPYTYFHADAGIKTPEVYPWTTLGEISMYLDSTGKWVKCNGIHTVTITHGDDVKTMYIPDGATVPTEDLSKYCSYTYSVDGNPFDLSTPITADTDIVLETVEHSYQKVEAKASSCTEQGNIEYYTCENAGCDKIFVLKDGNYVETTMKDILLPLADHTADPESVTFKFAADGSSVEVTYQCSQCKETFTVPSTEVTLVSAQTKAPTCLEKGETTYTATWGDYSDTLTLADVNPTGHAEDKISLVPAKAPTCKEDGYKEAYLCADCGLYYEEETMSTIIGDKAAYDAWILDAGKVSKESVEHTPADAVNENVVAPTCTEPGSHDEVIYCSVCGKELSRTPVVDSALGHSPAEPVRENIVEPTCTEAGSYDEVVYCSVCHEELSRTKISIPATGHVWDDGVITKPATCLEDGVKTFTCECGETKTEVIPATGHKLGELIPEVAATTEKEGMKAHYVCSECGQYFDANKQECTAESLVIAKLPEPTPEPKKGCGGSVIAASAVVTGLAIAGAALIAAKKKED